MVVVPTVTTQAASDKSWRNSGYDATLHGTITNTGGEDCTERGFEWGSSSGDYDQGWNEGPGPFGVGAFEREDSFHGTVYYRAYAMNSAGYGYGNERVISPPPPPPEPPTVTTQAASDKSWKTETFYWATLHGTIVDTGGESCVQGFEWGSSSGNYTQGYELPGTHGTGPFEHIDSFTGTVYYRAYARNSEGEGYGSERSFTPPPPLPPDVFGDQTEHTSNGAFVDFIHGCKATCPGVGIAYYIRVRVKGSVVGYGKIKCALYRVSDDGFVAATSERNVSLTTSWVWETFPFPSPPALSGQDYYIVARAWAEEGSGLDVWIAITSTPTAYKRVWRAIAYDGWPATSGVTESTGSASIYCLCELEEPDPPTVTTQSATGVGETTATLNGTITDTGGEDCGERGFDWGSSPGDYDKGWNEGPGPFGVGAFEREDSFHGTVYYRAYASNSAGYGYGGEQSFLCVPAAPTGVSATDGSYLDRVRITWIKSESATGYQVYRDGIPLGWLGDVATFDDYGAGAPSITGGNAVASDGDYFSYVYLSLSGTHTNNGEAHTYFVKARNAAGESGYSTSDSGYRGPGALGYQWFRSAADSDGNYGEIIGATSSTYDDQDAPEPTIDPGTALASDEIYYTFVRLTLTGESVDQHGRYYKCYLTASGCVATWSTPDRGYRRVDSITYQWYRSAGDSDASYSPISGGTTDPYYDEDAPAPTITHGSVTASDGTYPTYVYLSNTGESTTVGAGRYYKCLVSALGATPQYSNSNRGYRGVGTLTYQWQRSAADSAVNFSNIDGAESDPYQDTAAPAPTITEGTVTATDGDFTDKVTLDASGYGTADGEGRYYRCYHTASGAVSGYTGSNRGYRSPGALSRQWQKSAGDSDASYSDITGATSDPYDYMDAPAPTIDPGAAIASDGEYADYVALSLSGQSANTVGRYYRAEYVASGCVTQYTSADRGYRSVGPLTYQWQRSAADSDADYSNIDGATTASYNDTEAPANGDGRYFKCVENATGASEETSTSDRGHRYVVLATTMIGGPTGWVWGAPVASESIVRITSDSGLTWIWGLATGTITIPDGGPLSWSWSEFSF